MFGAIASAIPGGSFLTGFGAGTGIPLPGVNQKVAAPTGMVDFSSFPPAQNPLAAARDGEWQRFFRESGLVARAGGYR